MKEDFIKAKPLIEEDEKIELLDPSATFTEMDLNKNGRVSLLEFINWAQLQIADSDESSTE